MDQGVLINILQKRIKDKATLGLLKEIICSFSSVDGEWVGMPIGNLTSQIFANIYLNELDRFVKHEMKVKNYLRYGDDFIVLDNDLETLKYIRIRISCFLKERLKLQVNSKSDIIMKALDGLKFLGAKLWPNGRSLNKRNQMRIEERMKTNNISSYSGMLKMHGNKKKIREFNWLVIEKIIKK